MDGKSVSGVVPDSSAQALPLVDGSTTAESSMVTPWSAPVSAPELSPSSAPAPLYTSFDGTDAWDTPGRLGAARHAHSGEPPAPEPGHWARQTRTRGLERSNGPPPKLPATPRALCTRAAFVHPGGGRPATASLHKAAGRWAGSTRPAGVSGAPVGGGLRGGAEL